MPAVDFEAVFQSSPNAVMLLDRELRFVACNEAFLRATRMRREDVLGRSVFEAFPGEGDGANARRLRESLERVLATKSPDSLALIPYRVPRARGDADVEVRYWSATHTPILDAGGEVAFVLQSTTDVTDVEAMGREERRVHAAVLGRARRVEDARSRLDSELQHLRGLVEQAPGFVAVLRGADHVFEIANRTLVDAVGGRELGGRPFREALPEMASKRLMALLARTYETGEPCAGSAAPVRVRRAPGAPVSEALVDFVFQPIYDERGVYGIYIQGYEVTEQVRLAEERRALLDLLPAILWTARPDGTLSYVNRSALEYHGVAAEQLLGHAWLDLVSAPDRPAVTRTWTEALHTGQAYEASFRIRRADGEYRWHLTRAVPFRNRRGEITSWLGTAIDVDDQRRAREELQQRSDYEQQLIGIVSHDLRNPLNAISIAADLLFGEATLDAASRAIVARIVTATDRAARLIDSFLDFAQARTGGVPVRPVRTDLRTLVTQAVDELRLAHDNGTLELELSGPDLTCTCDPDRITQVLGNLVTNAFKYGACDAPVRVEVHGDADAVELCVHNDGAPIAESDRLHLFEPFHRGRTSRTKQQRGAGLGLFIAREIVAAHGGSIDVRSEAGAGTTFVVRLPRMPAATQASALANVW